MQILTCECGNLGYSVFDMIWIVTDSNLIPATRGAQQTIQHQATAVGTTAQLQIMEVLFAAI